jgi:ribosomal protein S18 acetylase RimI-like enzyme
MEKISIQKISKADLTALQHISRQTFYETFAGVNSEADMQHYLNNQLSDAQLLTELSEINSAFYFANQGADVIGYMKINWGDAQNEFKHLRSLELERIYMLKDFQGKKIGQLLFNKALEIATDMHLNCIWLGVWEHNLGAIRFYENNGLIVCGSHDFMLGQDRQTDILMKKDLINNVLSKEDF